MSDVNSTKCYEVIAGLYDKLVSIEINQTLEEISVLRKLLEKNNIKIQNSIIADIGGGTGRIAILLSKYCKEVYLIDPCKEMLENAKIKQQYCRIKNIQYFHEGIPKLSLLNNSIDVAILFFGVFQYLLELKDQLNALKNLFNILKPGGFILIDVMNYFYLIKKYVRPRLIKWENNSKIYKRNIFHKVHAIKQIWEHRTKIIIKEKKTGNKKIITSTHFMKMFSPNELFLLFQQTGFININIYSGRDINSEKDNRIWISALKPE